MARGGNLIKCFISAVACVLAMVATCAFAQKIAIVTDLSGPVIGPGQVTLLSEISVDTRLRLDSGARLVVIYLASGDEYSFIGPAQIQFQKAEPRVLSGAKPQKKASLLSGGNSFEIKPAKVTQAAYVMRGGPPPVRITLLTPVDTHTLDSTPDFRWQRVESGLIYRFELADNAGEVLYNTDVESTSVVLPPSVQLREETLYTWTIAARMPDGRRFVSSSKFATASASTRAAVASQRPKTGATFSERVAFATWLARMDLLDEARKSWKALAAERPEEPRLKALADE